MYGFNANKEMFILYYLLPILIYGITNVCSLSNNTKDGIQETFSNFTLGNDLWSNLLKKCIPPSINCISSNIHEYLKFTFDHPDDVQFTSFLKFPKNLVDYSEVASTKNISNKTNEYTMTFNNQATFEEVYASLINKTKKFFKTHDLELQLPDPFFLGATVKISPKSFKDNGALVNFELLPKSIENPNGEGRIFFKKIRKLISERLIYALLAVLLVIKLLAVKVLFILPTIVGVAAAKKLLLKVLLFLFPALHHLFKLCAYVPYGAKHHIHKHQISHIHEVGYNHHYKGAHAKRKVHLDPDLSTGIHTPHHFSDINKDYVITDHTHLKKIEKFGNFRKSTQKKDIFLKNQGTTLNKYEENLQPLVLTQTGEILSKGMAEPKKKIKEITQLIQQQNIHPQDLKNNLNVQQKLIEAPIIFDPHISTISHTKINNTAQLNKLLHLQTIFPATRLADNFHHLSADSLTHQDEFQTSNKQQENVQKGINYYSKYFHNDEPFYKEYIYKAAEVTYDPFYTPILQKIDKTLRVFNLKEEACNERLICSMYKMPSKFSPYSNLISLELSRESKDLQKPTSTNAAVIRFYRYVQAARDGQDKRDCLKLYPNCEVNL